MMTTFPADEGEQVTLANWRTAPFNKWAFHHVSEIVPSAMIKNDPANVMPLPAGAQISMPIVGGLDFDSYLARTHTDGLVIVHQGKVIHESYANGMTASDPHICMSVSKSMMAMLAGVLAEKGILDPNAEATVYIPELAKTAFAGATVQQLLDMRSGITFDEDYLTTSGPIVEYRKATNWNPLEPGQPETDLRSFLLTLTESDGPHGGKFDYKSPCTDLLGWIIERASGRRYADLFSELIWRPMGAESPAMVTVDRLGAPRTAGGMSVTTRDLARVGQMLCTDGARVISNSWIEDIETAGDPDAWANGSFADDFPGMPMHYRSKWYVFRRPSPVMFCLGIHGQNLFVDRRAGLVLA
ncbi:MAG: serine hydrolase, partial [Pseudomonadota bacterium]